MILSQLFRNNFLPYKIFDGSVLQLKAGLPTKVPDSQYATTEGIVLLPKVLEYS